MVLEKYLLHANVVATMLIIKRNFIIVELPQMDEKNEVEDNE